MKTVGTFALLIAALSLAGCVTEQVVWNKAGVTPAMFEQDKNQCVYEAKLGTPPMPVPNTAHAKMTAQALDEPLRIRELQGLCMQARGYKKQIVQAEASDADLLAVVPEIKQGTN